MKRITSIKYCSCSRGYKYHLSQGTLLNPFLGYFRQNDFELLCFSSCLLYKWFTNSDLGPLDSSVVRVCGPFAVFRCQECWFDSRACGSIRQCRPSCPPPFQNCILEALFGPSYMFKKNRNLIFASLAIHIYRTVRTLWNTKSKLANQQACGHLCALSGNTLDMGVCEKKETEKRKIKHFSPNALFRLGLHFLSTSDLAIGCLSPTSKGEFHWLQRSWETALCFPIYSTWAVRVKEQGRKIAAD